MLEGRIEDMLVERGYELSGLPPLTINPLQERWFRFQDKWKVTLGRIQIYGLPLVLRGFLSRRLRLKQWQQEIQLQYNAIDTTRLK